MHQITPQKINLILKIDQYRLGTSHFFKEDRAHIVRGAQALTLTHPHTHTRRHTHTEQIHTFQYIVHITFVSFSWFEDRCPNCVSHLSVSSVPLWVHICIQTSRYAHCQTCKHATVLGCYTLSGLSPAHVLSQT